MEAWIVTWEWMGESAGQAKKIVSILDPAKTSEEIAEIVQILYAHFSYTVGEISHFVADPLSNPYKSEISETTTGYNQDQLWSPSLA